MDRGTSKVSCVLNQSGKVNEMNHFSGIPGLFAVHGNLVTSPTYSINVITLCKMNLTTSWMVNVDFHCRIAKRFHTMLKSCCPGTVKYSRLYKKSCILLCVHHASYLETSEARVLWTRGRSFMS